MPSLTTDEFRLLAFMRGYADRVEQHLDPSWVQEMLEFSEAQMRTTARGLAAKGLVEVFEWRPNKILLLENPEIGEGPHMPDIKLTTCGWNYLRTSEA
jgi:hypothetical protein